MCKSSMCASLNGTECLSGSHFSSIKQINMKYTVQRDTADPKQIQKTAILVASVGVPKIRSWLVSELASIHSVHQNTDCAFTILHHPERHSQGATELLSCCSTQELRSSTQCCLQITTR